MGAASSEQNIVNPSGAVETPKTDTTSDQASRVSPQSTADLELLQSLAAKLKELTASQPAKAPTAAPHRPDSADVPASFTAMAASIASADSVPMTCAPDTGPNVRPGAGVLAGSPPIDSTQTVRALTPTELADSEASRWFAIQLMLSANQIDAAEVPNLDIFREYRLYTVTEPEQGEIRHALRLGFFSSELAAESVARYLAVYFSAPMIRRVSIAERERFADKLVTAGKDIGASGMHAVIELAGIPAPLPESRSARAPARAPATTPAKRGGVTAPARAPPATGRMPPPRVTSWLRSRRSKSRGGTDR